MNASVSELSVSVGTDAPSQIHEGEAVQITPQGAKFEVRASCGRVRYWTSAEAAVLDAVGHAQLLAGAPLCVGG